MFAPELVIVNETATSSPHRELDLRVTVTSR
jgi:hypothetical protein